MDTAILHQPQRILVYTAGFITIIGFLTLNNTAANVWRYLTEDFFLRCKLKKLVSGPLSVLFWFSMLLLWMLILAVSIQRYQKTIIGEEDDFPLKGAYWFAYITTTTVGFGDIHISHTEFTSGDMFFVPFLVLFGFNILGIFADKQFLLIADMGQDMQTMRMQRINDSRSVWSATSAMGHSFCRHLLIVSGDQFTWRDVK